MRLRARVGIATAALVATVASGCGSNLAPAFRATPASPLGLTNVERIYQPDWAGPVLFAPDAKPLQIPAHRFYQVEGEWRVPKARPTINCRNRWEQEDGSSLWIALDGWMATFKAHRKDKDGKWQAYDSSDVLQAGSESDVHCYHGGNPNDYPTSAYFWIEWAGTRNVRVTRHSRNLRLHAGDVIDVRIAAETTGSRAWQRATLWFANETTGQKLQRTFNSGCVDCGNPYQRRATLLGDTAEWMVEATFYSALHRSLPNTLDDFGSIEMTRVFATDTDGVTYDLGDFNGATPNVDWMTWNGVPLPDGGTLLACATIAGARTATFARAPYKIVTPGKQGGLEPKPQHCR